MRSMAARRWPSTSTLTLPSGKASSCSTEATQPTVNRSPALGSAISPSRLATSSMSRSPAVAAFRARIERSVPTKSEWTPRGKTTMSRSGSTAKPVSVAAVFVSAIEALRRVSLCYGGFGKTLARR